ncbi:hypothetical protein [Shewanella sp. YIC-542]|uniref:hypothetical protein n=1 Tax=Shewanella mytili TaxID=3377111 RepID=UPI00398F0CF9
MVSNLINILRERAEAAGFREPNGGKLQLSNDENWPEAALENQLLYCYSDFASILVVDISSDTPAEALKLAKRSETYLDAALLQREQNSSVIDGYLVLAMTKFDDSFRRFIIQIEKDTRFVRKHVVFHGENGWERYQRITPLGLVNSPSEAQLTEFIPDCIESSELLESLSKQGSTQLARIHGQEWNLNE